MRLVDRLISASLLTVTAVFALVACAWAGTPSGGGNTGCRPSGSRTLATDHGARAFSWHGSVYGCVDSTGQLRKLGGAGFCNLPAGHVAPVSLAGDLVAYGVESCGVDTGSAAVVVRNLATGRRLVDVPAMTRSLGPESYASVEALVLRRNGAVGWIAGGQSIVTHRPRSYEVHRYEGGKGSLLESGTAISPSSLQLAGSQMTWQDAGVTRSAGLR